MAQLQFKSDDTIHWSSKFGNGSDGAYAPSTGVDSVIDSACTGTINTTSLTATNASFAAGQLILIHQSQGTGAGQWQLNKITSYAAGTTTTFYPLIYGYATGAQVIVLKQYSSVNIANGVTLTGKAWNGTVGGIIAWVCNGTTTVTGSIIGTGKGFRGEAGEGGTNVVGNQGEGTAGAGGTNLVFANGNGGGGGGYSTNGPWDQGNGGGGGANSQTSVTAGYGTGGGNNAGGSVGDWGNAISNAELTLLTLGGAGGAGGTGTGIAGGSGAGGLGAGIVLIISKTITITGAVTLTGGQGVGNTAYKTGAGGSAAGGAALLKGQTITLGSNLITANGGTRVWRNGTGNGDGDGGSGGVGRIHADYLTSITGTTTPALDSTQDLSLTTNNGGFFAFL